MKLLLTLLGIATAAAQAPIVLTKPASAEKLTGTDGFIQRWLLLEPIGANGLTDSVVQATVKKEYFPGQFTVIPRDGDKVTVGGTELTWHAVDTKDYNVNLYRFAESFGKKTSDVLFWAVTTVNSPGRSAVCGWPSAPMRPPSGGSTARRSSAFTATARL